MSGGFMVTVTRPIACIGATIGRPLQERESLL